MEDIQFSGDQNEFGTPPTRSNGGFSGALVRWGLVRNQQQAQYVLAAVVIVALLIIAYLIFGSGGSAPPPAPVS